MTPDEPFHVAVHPADGVAVVTMAGTDPGNAMGAALWARLPTLVGELEADDDVRAVVLRGRGECFTVGLDLRWYLVHYRRMARAGEHGRRGLRAALLADAERMQHAIDAVERSPLPFVVAVHGACVGAGLELSAAADIRLASRDATFALREVFLGIVPDLGALQRLPLIVGAAATRELALTGRDVDADEARAIGLVTAVLDSPRELFEHARETAAALARRPPHVVAGIKDVLRHLAQLPAVGSRRHAALWNSAFMPAPEFTDLLAQALRDRPAPTT